MLRGGGRRVRRLRTQRRLVLGPVPRVPPPSLASLGGRAAALAQHRAMRASVDEVGRVLRARSRSTPTSRTAARSPLARSPAQLARARAEVAEARSWGRDEDDLRLLDAAGAGEVAGRLLGPRGDVHAGLRGDPPPAPGPRAWPTPSSGSACSSSSAPRCSRSVPAGWSRPTGVVRRPTSWSARPRATPPTSPASAVDWCRSTRWSIATEPLGPRPVGADRAAPPRDVHRPPAPDRLRAAHRGRPDRVRRAWRAVPLRLPHPSRASTATSASSGGSGRRWWTCCRCSRGTSDHALVGWLPRRSPGLVRVGRAGSRHRDRLGRGVRRRRGEHDQPRRPDPARPRPGARHRPRPAALGRPPLPAVGARAAALARRQRRAAGDGRGRRGGAADGAPEPDRQARRIAGRAERIRT